MPKLFDGASGVLARPDGRDAHLSVVQDGDRLCSVCRKDAPPYAVAAAYGSYETGLREMIHLLKYHGVRPAADVLGRMLSEVIQRMRPLFAKEVVLVIPVPLHVRKLRVRGFNQAELIIRSAIKNMDERQGFELRTGLLKRLRVTESQIGLTQNQRKENLRGAFTVSKPEMVKDREVLLVDDVFTTGTTASECARVLRRAGATRVCVATVARTLKKSGQSVAPLESALAAVAG
ncbi:MAG: ComF family protein [Terriglobales bacterium]